MKEEILSRISQEQNKLSEFDVEGHVWWNRFHELVESIETTKIKPDEYNKPNANQ